MIHSDLTPKAAIMQYLAKSQTNKQKGGKWEIETEKNNLQKKQKPQAKEYHQKELTCYFS